VYWLLAAGYAACRLLGKWLAGFGAAPVAGVRAPGPLGLGAGLFDHGGMALAIALGFSQFFVGPVFDLTLTAVVLSMLLTTLISPWSLRRTLQRAGEVP
jgi:Kef-type K+ transport system membrane component KefB